MRQGKPAGGIMGVPLCQEILCGGGSCQDHRGIRPTLIEKETDEIIFNKRVDTTQMMSYYNGARRI